MPPTLVLPAIAAGLLVGLLFGFLFGLFGQRCKDSRPPGCPFCGRKLTRVEVALLNPEVNRGPPKGTEWVCRHHSSSTPPHSPLPLYFRKAGADNTKPEPIVTDEF